MTLRQYDDVGLDLLADLKAAILDRSTTEPSFRSMNIGGWRSDEGLFAWDLPAARALAERIHAYVPPAVPPCAELLMGWAIVNRHSSFHRRHNHVGRMSGIFYVDRGDATTPTMFEGEEPGAAARAIDPVPGRLVVFPSSLYHWVGPYLGMTPRITIGFDVR
jgi:Putative 2OG-Fe(II) oxygenase